MDCRRARRGALDAGRAVWGLDYEVGIGPAGFRSAAGETKATRRRRRRSRRWTRHPTASRRSTKRRTTRNTSLQFVGDPALVPAVRDVWARPDAEAAWMLETLEETLEINRLWMLEPGLGIQLPARSVQSRELPALLGRRERRHKPKVMFKFGASHMVRGMSYTQGLDIGTQVPELAEARGGKSFHRGGISWGRRAGGAVRPNGAWTYRPGESGRTKT